MTRVLKNYWQGLQTRERWVLGVGVVFCIGLLIHQLLWTPWQNSISFMQEALVGHRTNLTWMQQQAEMLKKSDVGPSQRALKGRGQSLTSIVEQTARNTGISPSIKQLTPRENNTQVSVVLEGTSFNRWVRWIDVLKSDYGVKIIQLDAEREDKPDVAEIRVTFEQYAN